MSYADIVEKYKLQFHVLKREGIRGDGDVIIHDIMTAGLRYTWTLYLSKLQWNRVPCLN